MDGWVAFLEYGVVIPYILCWIWL